MTGVDPLALQERDKLAHVLQELVRVLPPLRRQSEHGDRQIDE